jgi:hypothetical protein
VGLTESSTKNNFTGVHAPGSFALGTTKYLCTPPALACRLVDEGLSSEMHSPQARLFIDGSSAGQLSATVAAIKEEKELRDGTARRQRKLMELLLTEGVPTRFRDCPETEAYINRGAGTARKVVAACKAL